MSEPSLPNAGRDTDRLVAEILGWTNVGPPPVNGPVDLVGAPPGAPAGKQAPVPMYSETHWAAWLAVEAFSAATGIEIVAGPCVKLQPDERWTARRDHGFRVGCDGSSAPTLPLALCRCLIDLQRELGELKADGESFG